MLKKYPLPQLKNQYSKFRCLVFLGTRPHNQGFTLQKFPVFESKKGIEFSMNKMLTLSSSIVNRLSSLQTEKIGFYRMLSNTRCSHEDLLEGSLKLYVSNMDTDHVLAIQDSTEFNYSGTNSKLEPEDPDVGPTGSSKVAVFLSSNACRES